MDRVTLPELQRSGILREFSEPTETIYLNTGVVSVGTFGSAVRATYTGIGLQTNIAARIQAQCTPGVHFPIAMYEPVS